MERWDQVAIVGVGLIGGSIGLALSQRGLASRIIGIGRRRSTLERALKRDAISVATTGVDASVTGSDLIIVCTPVDCVVENVRLALAADDSAVVTDVASTKASIVAQLDDDAENGGRFVGSHPLAGSEKTGVDHATADLFEGRTVVVTPGARARPAAIERVEQFWRAVGGRVVRMSPSDHDRAVAATSHLPHLVAAAVAAATPIDHAGLVAAGWLDTTRVAAGDPELWRQILIDNRGDVLQALAEFERVLAQFREAIERGNETDLTALLEAGKHHRDSLGN